MKTHRKSNLVRFPKKSFQNASNYQCFWPCGISKGVQCPCGGNSTRCSLAKTSAGVASSSYCVAAWDAGLNAKTKCPVYCTDTETYCSIPSYDSQGSFTQMVDYCATPGKNCECSKGSGVKSCESASGSVECIPASAYCAVKCVGSLIHCPLKDNYKPDGSWLNAVPPSKGAECVDKLSECECGASSRKCTDRVRGTVWCQATVYLLGFRSFLSFASNFVTFLDCVIPKPNNYKVPYIDLLVDLN